LKRLQLSFGVTEVSILYVCKFKLLLVNPNYHLVLKAATVLYKSISRFTKEKVY
jgi:hypothetical protein